MKRMTEAEWLACGRPHWMLDHLRPWKRRERKMWFYVCASCRRPRIWNHLKEPCVTLLEVATRHADGQVAREDYKAAMQAVVKMTRRDKLIDGEHGPPLFGQAILDFLRLKHLPGWEGAAPAEKKRNYLGVEARRNREDMRRQGMDVITEEQAIEVQKEHDEFMKDHVNFLRELFGNPFHQFVIDPTCLLWNDSTVVRLAQSIYDDRAFDRMPVLGDALEEAGCHETDILTHCRQTGEHLQGCWVVDLLVGKG